MERLDFINKRLRDKKEARDYIQNCDSAMLEWCKAKTITTGTSTIRLLHAFRPTKR